MGNEVENAAGQVLITTKNLWLRNVFAVLGCVALVWWMSVLAPGLPIVTVIVLLVGMGFVLTIAAAISAAIALQIFTKLNFVKNSNTDVIGRVFFGTLFLYGSLALGNMSVILAALRIQ